MKKVLGIILMLFGGLLTLAGAVDITNTWGLFLTSLGIIFIGFKLFNQIPGKLNNHVKALEEKREELELFITNKEEEKDKIILEAKRIAEEESTELITHNEELIAHLEKKLENKEAEWDKFVADAKSQADKEIVELYENRTAILSELKEAKEETEKLRKKINTQVKKLAKAKELHSSATYALETYAGRDFMYEKIAFPKTDFLALEELAPTVILKLKSMDVKPLRAAYKDNAKVIDQVLKTYEKRYTTKANTSIYQLMVIALRAELQNLLYNLKYEKLDTTINDVKETTGKYLKLAAEGNQSIAPTLTKFIGEIEHLFINAVKIEYEYYVKKEQEKSEQAALREQMRQEAEERKLLKEERKKIELEEVKYHNEITKIEEQLIDADDEKTAQLNARILELQKQLDDVEHKKEDVINRQNGKAGNVYVISNIGSFGENVFKIGMTRRIDPMERVKELSSASVPFPFDIHSFIFSDDAVALESKLHTNLNENRVNKVNLRKEFFNVTLDELETLVEGIDSTAEFNKTILAEQFRQSQYYGEH